MDITRQLVEWNKLMNKFTIWAMYHDYRTTPYNNSYKPRWRNPPPQFFLEKLRAVEAATFGWITTAVATSREKDKLRRFNDKIHQYIRGSYAKYGGSLRNQQVSIHNLDIRIGQIAKVVSQRPQGALRSNVQSNLRENVNAITLRSE